MSTNRRYKKASSRIAQRHKVRRYFSLFLRISLPVAFSVGLIFLLRADFLQVKNFEVLGMETIPQENIKNSALNFVSGTRFFLIPKSNIILLDKEKLTSVLLSEFTRLEKVEVNKQFFKKNIELSIVERKPDFLWCSTQMECFSMTKNGFIFEKLNNEQSSSSEILSDRIIFRGLLEGNPSMKNFTTPEKMQNYLRLVEILEKAGFEISSINIESSDKAVAKTNMGNLIFGPEEIDLSLVAENTILLINEIKSKNPSAQFDYIDARFGNKFFYKLF